MARHLVYKGSLDGSGPILKKITVGANQTIKAGYLLAISSNKAVVAGQAQAANTVLGVAHSDITTGGTVDADDIVYYDANPNSIYEFQYTGSSKTSLTNEDISKAFDLGANAYTINLDDTTGGYLIVQGFDNNRKTADCLIDNRYYGS